MPLIFYSTSRNKMPRQMFDCGGGGLEDLSRILDLFNAAMVEVKNVKTVEELQNVINNLNRVINEIKKLIAIENKNTVIVQ
jgi:hypothetical protein